MAPELWLNTYVRLGQQSSMPSRTSSKPSGSDSESSRKAPCESSGGGGGGEPVQSKITLGISQSIRSMKAEKRSGWPSSEPHWS